MEDNLRSFLWITTIPTLQYAKLQFYSFVWVKQQMSESSGTLQVLGMTYLKCV